MLLGLVINTVCMSLYDADKVRKSILVSCPLVIIYDIFVLSYSGIVYESVAMVSAAVGLIRYYKRKKEDMECSEQ
jgi:asparagine N-glycosylation enzyme membrane subunit Stt3